MKITSKNLKKKHCFFMFFFLFYRCFVVFVCVEGAWFLLFCVAPSISAPQQGWAWKIGVIAELSFRQPEVAFWAM